MEAEKENFSLEEALKRVQAMIRRYVPEGISLADELIVDRRREAQQEEEEAKSSPPPA